MIVMAEISDKCSLPEWPLFTGCFIGFVVLAVGALLSLRNRRLAVIPVVGCLPLFWFGLKDLGDPTLGPMLIDELGPGYLAQLLIKFTVPYLVAAVALHLVSRRIERFARPRQGLCGHCAYDLRGIAPGLCPECGLAAPGPT